MFEEWGSVTVSKIIVAVYVYAGTGRFVHTDRPSHGFVMNDETATRDYIFSDGKVLHTHGNDIFYLPEGSTYRVINISDGGCYAINFHIMQKVLCQPFTLHPRNVPQARLLFKVSTEAWLRNKHFMRIKTMNCLYGIIMLIADEFHQKYIPSNTENRILIAENEIKSHYTDASLSVSSLAKMCGVSPAYFRRIFNSIHGMSPKEYICAFRIEQAKRLLTISDIRFTSAQIAELCGYSDPCYFSREFHRKTGATPSDYRKSYFGKEPQ